MCGIFGSINVEGTQDWGRECCQLLKHRGPDEQNIWYETHNTLMMGHTRLAIIDIAGGSQPVHSQCGRYTMVYNGEIYNYLQLKKMLCSEQIPFCSNSDTEVLLKAIVHWGLPQAVAHLAGMYAFALWDQHTHTLHLVRDRVGIKPLYYAMIGNFFVFASELKPIITHPAFEHRIDRDALALYMKYKYVPTPHSIFKNVYKLPAATILSISPPLPTNVHLHNYWDVHNLTSSSYLTDFTETCEQLEQILRTSVQQHMLSDVPLGAFLSGGIDSATITALMTQSHSQVKTFNIGFAESSHDESQIATSIAQHLGTEHTSFLLTMKEAQDTIPLLPQVFDEPFADASQLPTLLVAQMAKKHIKVVLSGDGGDEVFAGYNRYLFVPKVMHISKKVPFRRLFSKLLLATPNFIWDYVGYKKWQLPDRIGKLAHILAMDSPQQIYNFLISCWQSPIVIGANTVAFTGNISRKNLVTDMMLHDFTSYLVDDILTKVDRTTMFCSLEARVPYLDHRVVEFASRIPMHMKIHNGIGKYILRKILYKYVPQNLFHQPKMGFALPLHAWLRSSLKDWAQDHFSSPLLKDFFHTTQIQQMWQQHTSGKRNYQEQLWSVLMFKLWLENYRNKYV